MSPYGVRIYATLANTKCIFPYRANQHVSPNCWRKWREGAGTLVGALVFMYRGLDDRDREVSRCHEAYHGLHDLDLYEKVVAGAAEGMSWRSV